MGILRTPMTQDRAGISSLRRRAACPSRPAAPVCPLVRQPCPRNRPADAVCRRFAAPSILRRCRRRCVRRYRSGRRRMYQPYVACAAIRARKRRTVPYRSPYQPQCLEGDETTYEYFTFLRNAFKNEVHQPLGTYEQHTL